MTTRWDVERAIFGSDLPGPARLVALALCALTDWRTATIPEEFTPSLSRITEMTGLARSTVTSQLNALERDGWVVRKRPDVAKARALKTRTQYRMRVPKGAKLTGLPHPESPGLASPGDGLARPIRTGLASPGDGLASPARGLELVRETDWASPGDGHVSTAPTKSTTAAAELAVMESTGATHDEATAIVTRIRNERNPRSIAGLVRRMAQDGDLRELLTEHRGAKRKTEVADAIALARRGPACPDGEQGGMAPHPVTGEPLCPKCRRRARLPRPAGA